MELAAFIRDIEDFPETGVIFKDITPLLNDPTALRGACRALLDSIGDRKIDKVVGVDSRGFIFAPMLAEKLGRSEEHTSELQSRENLVCRLLLEKKKQTHQD